MRGGMLSQPLCEPSGRQRRRESMSPPRGLMLSRWFRLYLGWERGRESMAPNVKVTQVKDAHPSFDPSSGVAFMTRRWFHRLAPLAVLLAAGLVLRAADAPAPPLPDLSDFHTVGNAVVTHISHAAPEPGQPAYLGVNLDADKNGRAVVSQVDANSPAAKAGLTTGDVLTELDGKPVAGPASVRELLAAKA